MYSDDYLTSHVTDISFTILNVLLYHAESCDTLILSWKGTQEGTLSCLIYYGGIQDGIFSRIFFYEFILGCQNWIKLNFFG